MSREHKTTMANVAAAAKVHVSTVSLGLRNSPLLPEATRARIRAAATKLGYRPDPLVSALMRRRRTGRKAESDAVLAFVTAFPSREGWRKTSPAFGGYFKGARHRAEEMGYRLEEFWLPPEGMSHERFSGVLFHRSIHGILLAPLPNPAQPLNLAWDHFSVVALGLTHWRQSLHSITHDHYHAMLTAMDRCHALGYRRIGLAVSKLAHSKVEGIWLAAYLLKCRDLALGNAPPPLVAETWKEEIVQSWYRRHRPDAIISTNPLDLSVWLEHWGLRPPHDLGLVNLNGTRPGEPVSSVLQSSEIIGARAIDLLVGGIEHNERGVPVLPSTMLVPGRWNEGQTLRQQMEAPPQRAFGKNSQPGTQGVGTNAHDPKYTSK
jgi:DNA-binding LacI/PurR family transcriptional regulator